MYARAESLRGREMPLEQQNDSLAIELIRINAKCVLHCHGTYFVMRWARTVLTMNRVHMSPALLKLHIFVNYVITTPGDEQLKSARPS